MRTKKPNVVLSVHPLPSVRCCGRMMKSVLLDASPWRVRCDNCGAEARRLLDQVGIDTGIVMTMGRAPGF